MEPQPQVVQPITTLTRSSQLGILEPPRPALGTRARDWLTLRGVVSEMSCRTQESSKVKMALVLMISQFSFAVGQMCSITESADGPAATAATNSRQVQVGKDVLHIRKR